MYAYTNTHTIKSVEIIYIYIYIYIYICIVNTDVNTRTFCIRNHNSIVYFPYSNNITLVQINCEVRQFIYIEGLLIFKNL